MATFLKHEPCPRCGSRDNLGRYSDGSAFCFGCHFYVPVTDSGQLVSVGSLGGVSPNLKEDNVQLSPYLCSDFPGHVVSWLAGYGITVQEAIKHGWKYDPQRDQLVFIFNDGEGGVACVQARNFNPEQAAKRKYYNSGSPAAVLPIFKRENEVGTSSLGLRTLVAVEDAVSAAKISRQCDAMPCLGSYLPARKLMALKRFYETLIVWLDSDKLREAWEIADMAKWIGMSAKTIYTEKDPKEYDDGELESFLNKGG